MTVLSRITMLVTAVVLGVGACGAPPGDSRVPGPTSSSETEPSAPSPGEVTVTTCQQDVPFEVHEVVPV